MTSAPMNLYNSYNPSYPRDLEFHLYIIGFQDPTVLNIHMYEVYKVIIG